MKVSAADATGAVAAAATMTAQPSALRRIIELLQNGGTAEVPSAPGVIDVCLRRPGRRRL
jgi:hypothetical protein